MNSAPTPDSFSHLRAQMVQSQIQQRGILDQRVLDVMGRVPRHAFVAERYRSEAYEDHPIQIGEGQTISQPFIVARMLEALALKPSDTVLEIGTGSGYQTALLAELVDFVYSVERSPTLAKAAGKALSSLPAHYPNIKISVGDGSKGMPEKAPFDAIVVSAAAPKLPKSLVEQLKEGGRMIIPVGPPQSQELQLIHRTNGSEQISHLETCRFVPLIGESGYAPPR